MNTVADQIRAEIEKHGVISFARFMELALYCPVCGYYEKERDTAGRRGDFYTSVSVGPLFGELLAFQFVKWLEAEVGNQKSELRIIEAGAHDGSLAKDILHWLKLRRPALFERIEYWIIEPSPRRQVWQRETLRAFEARVRWRDDLHLVGVSSPTVKDPTHPTILGPRVTGVIFSNELLDAMPVHRLGWNAQRHEWFEWGVAFERDKFVWTRIREGGDNPQPVIHVPAGVLDVLPDGFTTDVCPAAVVWWREAAGLLGRGKLMTIDYGLNAEDLFTPQRTQGTLRAYHRHRVSDDLLADPGEQDLTAHVNFTAIQQTGEFAGLKTETDVSQAQFLTGIAQRTWQPASTFGPWTQEHTRQFQTLTHPNHLGRAFHVLVQSRGD